MNDFLTYCARSKINQLIKDTPGCLAIGIIAGHAGGFDIEFLYSSGSPSNIMLSNSPPVLTDLKTLKVLKTASIDFDYQSGEFIITRERNEFPSYA